MGPRGWTPEQGERWQRSRDRILAAAKRSVDDHIERSTEAGLTQPFPGQPFVCNEAGLRWLAEYRRLGKAPTVLTGRESCPYTSGPCRKPDIPITREVGTVHAKWFPKLKQLGFWPEPIHEIKSRPCCVNGALLQARQLKKQGWVVEVRLGDEPEVQREYGILTGAVPCQD